MKAQRLSLVTLSLLSFLLLTACAPHDLDEAETGTFDIDVRFLWDKVPTASPSMMDFYLYPDDGSKPQRYMFAGRDGGRIHVRAGQYRAVAFNADTETILQHDMDSWDDARLTTPQTRLLGGGTSSEADSRAAEVPRAPGTDNEAVMMAPEMIWADRTDLIPLDDRHCVLTMHPDTFTCRYDVIVSGVAGIDRLAHATASLTGLAGSGKPCLNTVAGPLCTLPIDLKSTRAEETITGTLFTFGHCPAPATHTLMLYIGLTDGRLYYWHYDVTRQVHDAPNPKHVTIRIDGLDLPDLSVNNAVQVEEWDDVEIEMQMQ